MSEFYNFKPLSEVDSLQEPTSATNILAVENGSVKQIPASAIGGSGGGNFIVTLDAVIGDDGLVITGADKTFTEIIEAAESGSVPFAYINLEGSLILMPMIMGVNDESDGMVAFATINPMGTGIIAVVGMPNGTWTLSGV